MKRCYLSILLVAFCIAPIQAQQSTPPSKPFAKPSEPAQAIVPVPVGLARPNGKIQNSLVRITVTEQEPDYRAPWNSGAIGRGVGAGFVIDGNRIDRKST